MFNQPKCSFTHGRDALRLAGVSQHHYHLRKWKVLVHLMGNRR
ncbi:hypothetical protein FHS20_004270 [Phyllobacterium endophyticum]|nr:hypothetical protein [Phyllobacterium endophyticum]